CLSRRRLLTYKPRLAFGSKSPKLSGDIQGNSVSQRETIRYPIESGADRLVVRIGHLCRNVGRDRGRRPSVPTRRPTDVARDNQLGRSHTWGTEFSPCFASM